MVESQISTHTSTDSGRCSGLVLPAVIRGEGIWGLLVSLTHDLIVPALARGMGNDPQSPLYLGDGSFHIPGIFAAVLQFCLAGIVAIVLNSWVNRRPRTVRVATRSAVPSPVPSAPVATKPGPPMAQTATPVAASAAPVATVATTVPPSPVNRPVATPVVPASLPVGAPITATPAPAKPVPVATAPPPPQPAPAKPAKTKPKQIYYNIVGEPVESDD